MRGGRMKDIPRYLSERYSPWGWMGQRAHDAEAINRILPLDIIISCNYGREVPLFFSDENIFSVERSNGIRKNWSNEDLASALEGQIGEKVKERCDLYDSPLNLLCYRSVKFLESNALNFKMRPALMGVPEKLKRHFDNKILLHRNLRPLGLTAMEARVGPLCKFTFDVLRKDLGIPFVVQFPYGSSGSSTHIIAAEHDYRRLSLKHRLDSAVIREYINGYSININAVVLTASNGTRTLCSYPSVQITGAPECSNSPAAYCGNDYTAAASVEKKVMSEVIRQTKVTGQWMARSGYRGIFGMDFIVKGNKVYPVEINPRFQNSTALHAAATVSQGDPSKALFLAHIAEFLREKDSVMDTYAENIDEDDLMFPIKGAQIIVCNGPSETVVTGEIFPGLYNMVLGELVRLSEKVSLADCETPGDIVITCGVPKRYTRIAPGASICKIQFLTNALELSGKRRLNPTARSMVRAVYGATKLKDLSGLEVPVV